MSSVKVMPDMASKAQELNDAKGVKQAKKQQGIQNEKNTFANQLHALMTVKSIKPVLEPNAFALITTEVSAPSTNANDLNTQKLNESVRHNDYPSQTKDKSKQEEVFRAKPVNTEQAILAAAAASQISEKTVATDANKQDANIIKLQLDHQNNPNAEKYLLKEANNHGFTFENSDGTVNVKLHKKPLTSNQSKGFENFTSKGAEVSNEVRQTMLQQQVNRSMTSHDAGKPGAANRFVPDSQQNIRVRPVKPESVRPGGGASQQLNQTMTQAITAQAVQATARGAEVTDKANKPQQISNLVNGKKVDETETKAAKFESQRGASALDRARAAKEVADTFKKMISDKTTKMTIHLKPDSLGEVKIKLEIVDKNVTKVTMEALREVNDVLKNEEQNLNQIIEDAGLSMQNKMQFNDRDQHNTNQFMEAVADANQSTEITEPDVNANVTPSKHHDGNVNVEV